MKYSNYYTLQLFYRPGKASQVSLHTPLGAAAPALVTTIDTRAGGRVSNRALRMVTAGGAGSWEAARGPQAPTLTARSKGST